MGFHIQDLPSHIALNPSRSLSAVLLAFALIALTTRVLSGLASKSDAKGNGAKTVPMLPYWLPGLGHVISFMANQKNFMAKARDDTEHGVIGLNLGGRTFNVIFTPTLIKSILQQRPAVTDFDSVVWGIMVTVFGAPSRLQSAYSNRFQEFHDIYNSTLLRGPHLTEMLAETTRRMNEHIPNMISFVDSPVDQALWERVHGPVLLAGGETVEVGLFALLRDFLGHLSTPATMGQAFLQNNPHFLQDLWIFDYGLHWLSTGLPRWLPIPRLTRAHLARERLLDTLAAWHRVMDKTVEGVDPGFEWRDMDDVSELMKRRHQKWREMGLPPRDRASGELGQIWAYVLTPRSCRVADETRMNVNANLLCGWLVFRILSDPDLLSRILAEIAPHVSASQPPAILGMASPPRLQISTVQLTTQCPLFKACYLETLRLDSAPVSIRRVQKDFTISESAAETRNDAPPATYHLEGGSFVHIPYDAHQSDPRFFPDPEAFKPERFIVPGNPPTIDAGTLRPYGGGHSMCKGRVFAERECLAFVAGVLTIWDISPADERKGWAHPGNSQGSGVTLPTRDVRVRIKRRTL
ncbi:MAG: hypothetical protein M1832_005808 [Thelocarpon impressellum]|nr:MAG: hypothetical protein M1832_005808 [Thelocarpon impressellum]